MQSKSESRPSEEALGGAGVAPLFLWELRRWGDRTKPQCAQLDRTLAATWPRVSEPSTAEDPGAQPPEDV